MKNLISFLIIVLFFSCTAKKNSMHSSLEQQTIQQNDIADTKLNQLEGKKAVVDQSKSDLETTTETTIYDTDKPVNKGTGKPPVKSESKTTTKKSNKNDVKTDSTVSKKDESIHKDQSKVNEQAKEETKVVEKTKPVDGKYYFYILITLVLLVAGFFVYKNFAKIKTLLGWVS